jgi:hypothetical protein
MLPTLRKLLTDRPHAWAALALALVFCAWLPELWLGRAVIPGDADLFYGPYYMLVADFARAGRLLTWNPFSDGGLPDFVEPQVGALSPVQILFGLATGGTYTGYVLYVLAVWLAGGLAMLLLARHFGARAWEGLVVALGYCFSGFSLGHAQHVAFLYSLAWLPVLILCVELALRRRSRLFAAGAGVAWGLSMLGGYPSLALGNGALAVAWALARAACAWGRVPPEDRRTHARETVLTLALLVGIGLAVMAPILVGMPYEAAGISARTGPLTREIAVGSNALEPLALTTLFSPYFQRLSTAAWPMTDGTSCGMYTGALVLVLALAALFGRPRPPRLLLGGMVVLAILAAVGPATPVRGWLYDLLPPTRYFRHASVFRSYALFGLAVLAVLGLRDLRGPAPRRSWTLLACAAGAAALALWSFRRVTGIATDELLPFGRVHAVLAWSSVLLVGLLVAVTAAPWRGRALTLLLPVLAVLDAGAAEHLGKWHATRSEEWVLPWRALMERHTNELDLARTTGLERLHSATRDNGFGNGPSNRNFVTKQPVLAGYTGFLSALQNAWTNDRMLRYAAMGPQRLWFASKSALVTPDMDTMDVFIARTLVLGSIPLVLHERARILEYPPSPATPEELASLAALPSAVRQKYRLESYTPTRLELEIEARGEGWLLVTDRWARGWTARVNGVPTEVLPANFLYRAVPVTAGTNRVEMSYEPVTLPWTLTLSWGTVALVAGLGLVRLSATRAARRRMPA